VLPKLKFQNSVYSKILLLRLGVIACLAGSWQFGRGAISTGSDSLPQQVAAQLASQTAIERPQYTRFSTDALLAAYECHCGTGDVKKYSH
jgi:hypothetical protein